MALITDERLKEMEEEMNRFEEEISSVHPPMGRGRGGHQKVIIGSQTYHQVQAKLTHDDGPPGPFRGPPDPHGRMPETHDRVPGHQEARGPLAPPAPPPGPPGPPSRLPFPGALPPPPPPPNIDLAPRIINPSEIPLRPPPPPPLGPPGPPPGPPQHGQGPPPGPPGHRPSFVPPQLRHRPPMPPSGRPPFPPQHMQPPRPPGGHPHGMPHPPMGGPPGGPPPMGMQPNRPPFQGGFPPNHSMPYSGPRGPPTPRKPSPIIERPKIVYSAAPVRNVPKEEKEPEEPKEPEPPKVPEIVEKVEPEPAMIPMISEDTDPFQAGTGYDLGIPGMSMEADGDAMRKDKKEKKKKFMRTAAGIQWEDNTLGEWEQDDFRVFCGDIGNEVTEEVLARAFNKYPSFIKSRVVRDKRTNKTRGYGFVSFKDPNDFVRAMREMNGKYVGNRPIKLRKSNWKDRQSEVVKKKDKEKKRLGFR